MIHRIIEFSVKNKFFVYLFTLFAISWGVWAVYNTPLDAIPDLSDPQVIIYTQWGDTARALQWLETAMRLRDPGLASLKTDPLMDPVRKEPRFQAIERELKFPN